MPRRRRRYDPGCRAASWQSWHRFGALLVQQLVVRRSRAGCGRSGSSPRPAGGRTRTVRACRRGRSVHCSLTVALRSIAGLMRAVRIVAVGALHLAFDDRVVRRLQRLRRGSAGGTCRRCPLRSDGRSSVYGAIGRVARLAVDAVAVRARDVVQRMLARFPERELPIRRVAGEADGRLLGRRSVLDQVRRLVLGRVLQVLGGIAVACLAHRAAGVVLRAVRGHRDRGMRLLVAARADRRGGLGLRRGLRLRRCLGLRRGLRWAIALVDSASALNAAQSRLASLANRIGIPPWYPAGSGSCDTRSIAFDARTAASTPPRPRMSRGTREGRRCSRC